MHLYTTGVGWTTDVPTVGVHSPRGFAKGFPGEFDSDRDARVLGPPLR